MYGVSMREGEKWVSGKKKNLLVIDLGIYHI